MHSPTSLLGVTVLALVSLVSAHGYVSNIVANGQSYPAVNDPVSQRHVKRDLCRHDAQMTRFGTIPPQSHRRLVGLLSTKTLDLFPRTPTVHRKLPAISQPLRARRRFQSPRDPQSPSPGILGQAILTRGELLDIGTLLSQVRGLGSEAQLIDL